MAGSFPDPLLILSLDVPKAFLGIAKVRLLLLQKIEIDSMFFETCWWNLWRCEVLKHREEELLAVIIPVTMGILVSDGDAIMNGHDEMIVSVYLEGLEARPHDGVGDVDSCRFTAHPEHNLECLCGASEYLGKTAHDIELDLAVGYQDRADNLGVLFV